MDLDKKFWDKVKAQRSKSRISQAEMANELGMTQAGYRYYESKKSKITPQDIVIKVANKLDVTPEYLFDIDKLVLDHYSLELKEWLASPESKDYVLVAYHKWQQDKKKS